MASRPIDHDHAFKNALNVDWVMHFLLNNGSLALSGKLGTDVSTDVLYIDVSNLSVHDLAQIDTKLGGYGVCVHEGNKITFPLHELCVRVYKGAQQLCCKTPTTPQTLPSRQASRLDLAKGIASIQVGSNNYNISNISEGGCAFSCPDRVAKHWPPGQEIECIVVYQDKLRLTTKLSVVRIQHDISSTQDLASTVSCRFTDPSMADLAQAMLAGK
jgi:hypothetical protein